MRSPSVDQNDAAEQGGLAAGSVVAGKYRIEALLGRGGMGAVYRAQHVITGRRVALKWLLGDGEAARRRFLQEARSMGALQHPNVVGVLDVGEHQGSVFLVMEHLEGKNLRDLVGRGPVPPARAIALLMPALEGVAAAHDAGLVHRDLKPENLFVCLERDGTAYDTKVLDLGVARSLRRSDSDGGLTKSGAVVGTPRYMAPEQVRGARDLDQRVDVFALGLILYELLTGRLPYDVDSYESLVIEIATCTPPSPRVFRPELPEALANAVLKALAKQRDDRYPNVAALAADLEPFADGLRFRPPRASHVRHSSLPPPLSESELASAPTGVAPPSGAEGLLDAMRPSREPTTPARPADARNASTPTVDLSPKRPASAEPDDAASAEERGTTSPKAVALGAVAVVGLALALAAGAKIGASGADRDAAARSAPPSGTAVLGASVSGASAVPTETDLASPPGPAGSVLDAGFGAIPLDETAEPAPAVRRVPRVHRREAHAPPPAASDHGTVARGRAGVLRPDDF